MADEEEAPAVTLGEGESVEGAPLARVSARLMWGIEQSAILDREGETVVRTPDGPRELAEILEAVDQSYFATRQEFEDAVRDVVGHGPVPTAGVSDPEDGPTEADEEPTAGESGSEADEELTAEKSDSVADEEPTAEKSDSEADEEAESEANSEAEADSGADASGSAAEESE